MDFLVSVPPQFNFRKLSCAEHVALGNVPCLQREHTDVAMPSEINGSVAFVPIKAVRASTLRDV